MKRTLAVLALLAFLPRPVQSQQNAAEFFELEIDNVSCGRIRQWQGGDMKSPVILETPGADRIAKKHAGIPRCTPLVVEVAMPPAKPLVDWMTAVLAGQTPRKTVQINRYTSTTTSGTGLKVTNCLLTKIAFPGLDVAGRTTPPLLFTFEGDKSGTATVGRASNQQRSATAWTQNSFKFTLGGAEERYVTKIDPFAIVLKTTTRDDVDQRFATVEPGTLEIPNLTVFVDEAHADTWKDWHHSFVIQGNNRDDFEKTGSLDFVQGSASKSLLKINFLNLGIFGLGRETAQSGSQTVTRAKAEVYCERMEISLPADSTGEQGAAPPAPDPAAPAANNPPPPPAPAPAAPAPTPAAPAPAPAAPAEIVTHTSDQGLRDPFDFPRPKETVRKSYSSNRNKIISTEMASYSANPTVSGLDAVFDDLLKKGGWDSTSRNESGEPKKGTHSIALILKKGARTANLTIGQAKDGTTEYTVVLNEPADAPRPIRPLGDPGPTPAPAAGGVNKDELRDRTLRPALPGTPAPGPVPATAPVAASTAKMTPFDPKVHGFKFTNDFRNSVFGPPIKVVTSGLCGGMSYAALDYFLAGVEVPKQDYRPAHNTPLQTYLYRRQETSLLFNLDNWANYELNPAGTRSLEIFNWGLRERLAELRASIDRGVPVPLGLKGTGAGFGHDHQVLAIGYDMGRYKGDVGDYKEELNIFLCEPNYPGEVITMVADQAKMEFTYKGYEAVRWRSYFVDVKYTKMAPPAIRNPVDPQANRDGLMHALRCRFVTGAEELRGGTLFVNLAIVFHDGTRQDYQNISEGGRWLPEYTETVEVVLTKPRKLEDIRFIEINTSNKVGPRGDRWDMKECSITVLGGGYAQGMPFKEVPAYKFVGLPLQIVPK